MNQQQIVRLIHLLLRLNRIKGRGRWVILAVVLLVGFMILRPLITGQTKPPVHAGADTSTDPESREISREDRTRGASDDSEAIIAAYETQRSNAIVRTSATVHRLLLDDNQGDRHQKMILRLRSGHTVLLAHNIDLAPRVPAAVGDTIEFQGEYEYSQQGGVVHWTHHDPRGRHKGGWIRHQGETYE